MSRLCDVLEARTQDSICFQYVNMFCSSRFLFIDPSLIVLGDGGHRGTAYDRTWRRWLPQYGLCNGSSAGQVVTPPGMCLLVEHVKVSVCGGDTTWTADEPLHNLYHGGHRRQVRSM